MTIVYKITHNDLTVSIDKCEVKKTANIILRSKTPQYVTIIDGMGKKSNIYDLSSKIDISVVESYTYYDSNYNDFIFYICLCSTQLQAQIYASIYQVGLNPQINKIGTVDKVVNLSIRGKSGNWTGLLNTNSTDKYLIGEFQPIQMKPNIPVYIETDYTLDTLTIRDSKEPTNITYSKLHYSERESYIPVEVLSGSSRISQYKSYSQWVKCTDNMYSGKLTYEDTTDKFIHMHSDKGQIYYYRYDVFKKIIPSMNNGIISGTFIYKPFASSRYIDYYLILYNSNNMSGLMICESSDSESESESESDLDPC